MENRLVQNCPRLMRKGTVIGFYLRFCVSVILLPAFNLQSIFMCNCHIYSTLLFAGKSRYDISVLYLQELFFANQFIILVLCDRSKNRYSSTE